MRVDVQNPIQSLHAFMRHHFGEGGRNSSSPISRNLLIVATVLCIGAGTLVAQDKPDSGTPVNDAKRMDQLFDRIMQTLPEGERSKVDSAAAVKIDRKRVSEKASTQSAEHDNITPRERLRELPDELKVQVERVITDMEQRKEDRKAQFRESIKNR